jgi:hypothetical protein
MPAGSAISRFPAAGAPTRGAHGNLPGALGSAQAGFGFARIEAGAHALDQQLAAFEN